VVWPIRRGTLVLGPFLIWLPPALFQIPNKVREPMWVALAAA
jgi:hypothetical protein